MVEQVTRIHSELVAPISDRPPLENLKGFPIPHLEVICPMDRATPEHVVFLAHTIAHSLDVTKVSFIKNEDTTHIYQTGLDYARRSQEEIGGFQAFVEDMAQESTIVIYRVSRTPRILPQTA